MNCRHFYESYETYESHATVDALNASTRAHLRNHGESLTKSAVDVLMTISRYSCVIVGVSWLRNATLAKILGISERTVRRAYAQLKDAGIIDVVATQKGGLRAKNLIVIRAVAGEMSERAESNEMTSGADLKEFEQKETIKTKIIKKRTQPADDLMDHTYTSDRVPKKFARIVSKFIDNARAIEKLWSRAKIAAWRNVQDESDSLEEIAIDAWKKTVNRAKWRSSGIRNIYAYFYRIADYKFEQEYARDLSNIEPNAFEGDFDWNEVAIPC